MQVAHTWVDPVRNYRQPRSAKSAVVGGAGSLGRDTEKLEFANLAARVAAAARRVANNRPLDPRRDIPFLEEAQELLRQGAATLEDKTLEGKTSIPARSQHASYTFARFTSSVVEDRPIRPSADDLDGSAEMRKQVSQRLVKLAEQIEQILTHEDGSPEVHDAAKKIQVIFDQVSSNILGELGSPGDSLRGLSA